jgi:methionyl-tRNA formyltransferase
MRVLFFGYSQMGAVALDVLAKQGHDVVTVVTHRDDPHENRWYRVPAEAAKTHGFPVVYAEEVEGRYVPFVREKAPDLLLSVFYRKMIPSQALPIPKIASLNLHPSLLPAYRGRAPVNWVLVNGERVTGVSLHHMTREPDAGDVVGQRAIEIAPRETALTLYHKVEAEGRALLEEMLPLVASGKAPRTPQDASRATYFGGRKPDDGRIDWSWDARRIDCLVRAVAPPWPGAFGAIEGKKVFIHAGEPSEAPGRVEAPGTARRLDGKLYVSARDRWFRVDEMVSAEAIKETAK